MKKRALRHIRVPKILDDCILCFVQEEHIPFTIKRVYHISSADTKLPRGYHAHKKTLQALFCIQGSIQLLLDDGKQKRKYFLDKPDIGIFIDKMVWHQMHDFKKNTILLVLSSAKFNEKDYIRDYDKFKKRANQ